MAAPATATGAPTEPPNRTPHVPEKVPLVNTVQLIALDVPPTTSVPVKLKKVADQMVLQLPRRELKVKFWILILRDSWSGDILFSTCKLMRRLPPF